MKQNLTFLFSMIFSFSLFSQTILFEDFSSGQMPPDGWTTEGYSQLWTISNTNNASGLAPEGCLTYGQNFGSSRLISLPIDLTDYTSIKMVFKYNYVDVSGSSPSIGLATRSNNGPWTSVWEITHNQNVMEEVTLIIDNDDVGQADFQFSFYVTGPLYFMLYWYFDDILLITDVDIDGALYEITTEEYTLNPVVAKGTFVNYGSQDVTSFEIAYRIDNGQVHHTVFEDVNIPFYQSYEFECNEELNLPAGNYVLDMWVAKVNGEDDPIIGNNSLQKEITVPSHVVYRRPFFEEFTGST